MNEEICQKIRVKKYGSPLMTLHDQQGSPYSRKNLKAGITVLKDVAGSIGANPIIQAPLGILGSEIKYEICTTAVRKGK